MYIHWRALFAKLIVGIGVGRQIDVDNSVQDSEAISSGWTHIHLSPSSFWFAGIGGSLLSVMGFTVCSFFMFDL